MKALVLAAALLLALAEADDTWKGATPIDTYGCSKLEAFDVDWWRLRRNHAAAFSLYIDGGTGCLCACAQGDAYVFGLDIYDASGNLLLQHAGLFPSSATLPLYGAPLGQPLFFKLSGAPAGSGSSTPYRLIIF